MIISLLLAGFKVYVFDVDGEYFNLCRAVNGTWVPMKITNDFKKILVDLPCINMYLSFSIEYLLLYMP
ncbi:MAG: hypothetical protein ACYDG2_22430 [Ruminiclostridium sp.]